MKSHLKSFAAIGALALGLATSNVFAQPGAGAPGGGAGAPGGGAGRAGGGAGRAGGGAGGGAGARAGGAPAPLTMDAIKAGVTGLTPEQLAKIDPIVAEVTKAQAAFTKAQDDYNALRNKNLDAIRAALTDAQKTAFESVPGVAAGRGGRAGGAGFGGGAGGGAGFGAPGAGAGAGPGAGAAPGAGGRQGRRGGAGGAPGGAPAGAPGA